MHHIISDGWSVNVLLREISRFYEGFAAEREVELEPLPIQYGDWAEWQREWLDGAILADQLNYWKEQLEGAPPVLELPTDRPHLSSQIHYGATERFEIDEELTTKLRVLSRAEGCTLFMTLLSAFQILLSRWSNQQDIIIGTPIANRARPEIEGLIGFFVNTLALRTRLDESLSFKELLQRNRETCLGAYAHQDLPFEKLVAAMQPERRLTHSPLFQVMFNMNNAVLQNLHLPGLQSTFFDGDVEATKVDLHLMMREHSHIIEGNVSYESTLFSRPAIRSLIECFVTLTTRLGGNSRQKIRTIPWGHNNQDLIDAFTENLET
jgi:hypothetical protein